jgi:mitochondrial cardiolipin hydrolase
LPTQIHFARDESIAGRIVRLLHAATATVDGALYRFNHAGLAQALKETAVRGVRVRLLVDGNKYKESRTTQELLGGGVLPFRPSFGRQGRGTKMHHKFVVIDQAMVLTGSYNWTIESEEENHENLLIIPEPESVKAYRREFEALWTAAGRDAS